MRMPRIRFRLWWLLVAVAIVSVCFAAARAETGPGTAVAIVVASVSCLAYTRYSEAVALRKVRGLATSRSRKAALLLVSAIIAAAFIGLSDIAFLAGYYVYMEYSRYIDGTCHWSGYREPDELAVGVSIGFILALCVASFMRHTFWPQAR